MTITQTYIAVLKYPPCPSLQWVTVKVRASTNRQAVSRAINMANKFWGLNKASRDLIIVESLVVQETQGRLI